MLASLQAFLHDRDNALLLVALLLCIWLWLLERRQTEQASSRPQRTTALSVEELGRAIFSAAQTRDLHAYRDLFLNGAEAAALMGRARAETWLAQRSIEALEASLASLGERIPPGSIFEGAECRADECCVLHVRRPDGSRADLVVGHVTRVGPAWRLCDAIPAVAS